MSALDDPSPAIEDGGEPYPAPEYFKADIPFNSELICITRNDWPYSGICQTPCPFPGLLTVHGAVPLEIEHSLVWSRVPIFHAALIPPAVNSRVQQDGLCGFTGSTDSTESFPSLESCLPALADWGVTMDELVRSVTISDAENAMVEDAGREVREFVKRRWKENQWETAWFVNPPVGFVHCSLPCVLTAGLRQRLQSIPGLAHIHVFARRKTAVEEAAWSG